MVKLRNIGCQTLILRSCALTAISTLACATSVALLNQAFCVSSMVQWGGGTAADSFFWVQSVPCVSAVTRVTSGSTGTCVQSWRTCAGSSSLSSVHGDGSISWIALRTPSSDRKSVLNEHLISAMLCFDDKSVLVGLCLVATVTWGAWSRMSSIDAFALSEGNLA